MNNSCHNYSLKDSFKCIVPTKWGVCRFNNFSRSIVIKINNKIIANMTKLFTTKKTIILNHAMYLKTSLLIKTSCIYIIIHKTSGQTVAYKRIKQNWIDPNDLTAA